VHWTPHFSDLFISWQYWQSLHLERCLFLLLHYHQYTVKMIYAFAEIAYVYTSSRLWYRGWLLEHRPPFQFKELLIVTRDHVSGCPTLRWRSLQFIALTILGCQQHSIATNSPVMYFCSCIYSLSAYSESVNDIYLIYYRVNSIGKKRGYDSHRHCWQNLEWISGRQF
jgi:hypothetical protein